MTRPFASPAADGLQRQVPEFYLLILPLVVLLLQGSYVLTIPFKLKNDSKKKGERKKTGRRKKKIGERNLEQ
jgi:hypothetical protein